MKLVVVTPVGPGHDTVALQCRASVRIACRNPGSFTSIEHEIVSDSDGKLGRGRARNAGMTAGADWYFFLDADDTMASLALQRNDFSSVATFGALYGRGQVLDANVYPCDWNSILQHGARGTLSMGFFCRSDVAQELKFDEDRMVGEDFDFYLRLPGFVKIKEPLVYIGLDIPPAGGSKGYAQISWQRGCTEVINFYRDAILAKAGGS